MKHDLDILVSAKDVQARIDDMTSEIAARLDDDAVVVGLLQGAFIFMADVVRGLARHEPTSCGFQATVTRMKVVDGSMCSRICKNQLAGDKF
jgi:hypoxanthine-guanine phosphoribosyltransferase